MSFSDVNSPMSGDASEYLARIAVDLTFADLSEASVFTAKAGILDTLGVCLAATGNATEYVTPVRRFVETLPQSSGNVPAPTLGRRLAPLDAVFWLGALAHALDFDDVAGYSHPSGPVVSAALPLASSLVPVSGKRLITAVAIGQDMVIRLAQALHKPISAHGWLPSIPGIIGAAATTSKLLDLNLVQTRSSLGNALHQTSGTMQALARPGSAYRAIREGFNARAGALSALLAREGLSGDDESLEGEFGYFRQFFSGEYDPEFLRGAELLNSRTSFKPWPCAGHPQLFITALKTLIDDGEIDTAHVKAVRITGCSDLLPHQCEPIETRAAPEQSIDAKVSIPFLLGKMLTHGTLTIADFRPDGLQDQMAREHARKVTWHLDQSLQRGPNGYGIGIVEVEHDDGRVARAEAEYPLGHPSNPLTWDDIVTKFERCVHSAGPSAVDSGRVIEVVSDLENVPNVGVLLELVEGA